MHVLYNWLFPSIDSYIPNGFVFKIIMENHLKAYISINGQIVDSAIFFEESSCFELGKITLDKEISIFEIKQKSKNDPRITLTRDAFKIMESK